MKALYKKNALIVLLMILVIALPALSDSFDPYNDITLDHVPIVDYHPTIILGEMVVIQNQDAYASPLLHAATSKLLDKPLGIYVNEVQAHRLHRWDGVGQDEYVEIAIGGNGLDGGFSGYIDERHLVYPGAATLALPTVTLNAQGVEDIALRSDFSEDAPIITVYPNGTQAQLLGYLDDMCHVQIGDQSGFVKTSQIQLPQTIAQGLEDAMPNQFMNLTPVHKHIIEIGIAYEIDQLSQYGSKDYWPLWLKAEYADLYMKLGLGVPFDFGVYIMPGPDDLPQQEAMDIAAQAASDHYGIALETLLEQFDDVSVSFFDATYRHTGHYWRIIFSDRPPSGIEKRYFEMYISSPAGEVVDFNQDR